MARWPGETSSSVIGPSLAAAAGAGRPDRREDRTGPGEWPAAEGRP